MKPSSYQVETIEESNIASSSTDLNWEMTLQQLYPKTMSRKIIIDRRNQFFQLNNYYKNDPNTPNREQN